ncbi:hypothetical protein [Mycobacterium sp.]|uniref:hypothetical protein n=1 Tax=Mycobacterium sp. TaxID=1785 RepID=UPI003D6A0817
MRTESVWAVIGGIIIGYIGWLVAISIGAAFTTVSLWSPIVLVLSVLLAIWAALWGRRLRERGSFVWAAFVFAVPIPPVLLTLAVGCATYL